MADNIIEGFDDDELADKIWESEGFDYFFSSYLNPDSIKEPKLRRAVKEYLEAREEILDILGDWGIFED